MSQWSHEHPELDPDQYAEAAREEADCRRMALLPPEYFPPAGTYGCSRTGHVAHVVDTGDLSGTRAKCGAILHHRLPAQVRLETIGLFDLTPCANCAAILPLRRYMGKA